MGRSWQRRPAVSHGRLQHRDAQPLGAQAGIAGRGWGEVVALPDVAAEGRAAGRIARPSRSPRPRRSSPAECPRRMSAAAISTCDVVAGVRGGAAHERGGQLERLHRQTTQVREVGVAGAEVVDGDADAHGGDGPAASSSEVEPSIASLSVSSTCRPAAGHPECWAGGVPAMSATIPRLADLAGGEVHRQQQRLGVVVSVATCGPGLRLPARLRRAPTGRAERCARSPRRPARTYRGRSAPPVGRSHRTSASTPTGTSSASLISGWYSSENSPAARASAIRAASANRLTARRCSRSSTRRRPRGRGAWRG